MSTPKPTPAKIKALRREIDHIDAQIARLCAKRTRIASRIIELKETNGTPLFDKIREQSVLASYTKKLMTASRKDSKRIQTLVAAIIRLTPNYTTHRP